MPLKAGYSKSVIRFNTEKLIDEGYPAKQAYAIAMDKARKARGKKGRIRSRPK